MVPDRSHLLKRVFPKLRAMAKERDVMLTELDLRWGVTTEEGQTGRTLEICLSEVENCTPFFIGLIGNRYGMCPKEEDTWISPANKGHFNWVYDDMKDGRSVTEMEMQYGALRRTDPVNAYFFICTDKPESDNDNPEKMAKLKDAVRNNGRYPVTEYKTPEELGKYVEKAFCHILDRYFPKDSFGLLERIELPHNYIRRSFRQNYIPKEVEMAKLDSWADDLGSDILVITGNSGIGKTALVCNWLDKIESEGRYRTLYHAIGHGDDGYYTKILEQLSARMDVDDNFEEHRQTIVVLDGLENLDSESGGKDLLWLNQLPEEARIICITTEDDTCLFFLKELHAQLISISTLSEEERRRMIQEELRRYGKILSEEQLEMIVSSPLCGNPSVLKTLLEELICSSNYENLETDIRRYLNNDNPLSFYDKVLSRLEDSHGVEPVKEIFSLLSLSKLGMAEQEIMELLDMKPLLWSEIYGAINTYLLSIGGRLCIGNNNLQQSVCGRYLANDSEIRKFRMKLLNYFKGLNQSPDSLRYDQAYHALLEISYQLYALGDRARDLFKCISDPIVFRYLFKNHKYLLLRYLVNISESDCGLGQFTNVKVSSEDYSIAADYYDAVIESCVQLYDYEIACDIAWMATDWAEKVLSEDWKSQMQLTERAVRCVRQMKEIDLPTKERYKRDIIKLINLMKAHPEDSIELAEANGVLAEVLSTDSMSYFSKQYEIYKRLGIKERMLLPLNNMADIYDDMGDAEHAIEYYEKALSLSIESFGELSQETATIYMNLGFAYGKAGLCNKQVQYMEKSLFIFERILFPTHQDIGDICHNLGYCYHELGDSEKAIQMFTRAKEINKINGVSRDYSKFGL